MFFTMAMTQDPDVEGTVVDDESTEVSAEDVEETADSDESDERTADAASDDESKGDKVEGSSPTPAIDLNKIPKELRPQVEEALKAKDLEWKRTFTRNTQEASARTRAIEAEAQNAKARLAQYEAMARDVMANPDKLDAYRKLYAPESAQAPQPLPKFETVEDVLNYVDQKYTSKMSEVERRAQAVTTQTIQAQQQELRWDGALNKMRVEAPRFQKYENIVAQMTMKDPKYKAMYTGSNEQEVLKAAFDDFNGLLQEDMKSAKQEVLSGLQKKKSATTQQPRRTVTTTSTRPASDADAVIARVRAKFGEG